MLFCVVCHLIFVFLVLFLTIETQNKSQSGDIWQFLRLFVQKKTGKYPSYTLFDPPPPIVPSPNWRIGGLKEPVLAKWMS